MIRFALLALAAAAVQAQIQFTRIESPNFELFTDGAKGRAVDILEHFEKVRSFFAQTIDPRTSLRKPRVVVLNSAKSFAAFVDRKTVVAYYIGLPHRDLIVIGPGGGSEDNRTITHEYVHLLVHQAELPLPLWLNEGIAEVYSTLQPVGNKMRVGTPITSHTLRLRREWLDIRQVVDAETYGSEAHIGPFYAMSWAIAHMILLEDDLRVKWPRFVMALEKGLTGEQALKKVYGMAPQQLEQHVQGYIRGKSVNVVDFNFKWSEWKEKAIATPASALENGLTMIDLHLSGRDFPSGIRRAENLAAAFPDSAAPWEGLATARLYEGNFEGAATAIAEAYARGGNNPDILARGAALSPGNRTLARQMIDRALTADPGHVESLLQLASWHLSGRDYPAAFATVRRVTRISHADTPRFMNLYVRSAVLSGQIEVARAAVKDFRGYAVSDKDKAAAEKLAAFVENTGDVPAAADARRANGNATGLLVEVDCQNNGQVLHVLTAEGLRQIVVDAKRALEVGGENVNIGCGPQKRKRRVRVGVSPEGLARKLEFLP